MAARDAGVRLIQMNRITHFSKHALDRLEQRSSLTFYELAKILDCHVFIDIGNEPGFNRQHRLFYSDKDEAFYVAIQDIHTGGVVTVLPPEYHENISWKIKSHEFMQAKELALAPPKEFEDYENISLTNNIPPSTFIITALFNDIDGNPKIMSDILKISASPYNMDIGKLISDRTFGRDIQNTLEKKDVASNSVYGISIRLGKKGERLFFDWSNGEFV